MVQFSALWEFDIIFVRSRTDFSYHHDEYICSINRHSKLLKYLLGIGDGAPWHGEVQDINISFWIILFIMNGTLYFQQTGDLTSDILNQAHPYEYFLIYTMNTSFLVTTDHLLHCWSQYIYIFNMCFELLYSMVVQCSVKCRLSSFLE